MKEESKQISKQERVLLVASFGTTAAESRRLNIDAVEQAIGEAAGDAWSVRRCFTSQTVIGIIEKREGIRIDNVRDAVRRALSEGARYLAVQPTHLMKGLEYDKLKEILSEYDGSFEGLSVGDPLLSSDEDIERLADALAEASAGYEDGETALVFMGHGTDAASNDVYTKLQSIFSSRGKKDYYIGTVEAEPSLDDVIASAGMRSYRRAVIRPLMLVAGNHAIKDMASADDPGSWYSRFSALGYDTVCITEGLGQIPAVRAIYADHAKRAVESLKR